ncbi:hypothetical protein LCGC14_1838040 [marine sediment metagenome]|uniref:Uncharacterized protein n=1 Tax=marine sediment metagenome TaxID=412755 RepID=A0A0F9JDE1_9ZZZZ
MIIGQVHIDRALTNFARGYKPEGFIANEIWPVIGVPNETDLYDVWDQADIFRPNDALRGKGQLANRIRVRVSSDNYRVRNYELAAEVFAEDRNNADPSRRAMLEQGRVVVALDKIMLGWEDRMATIFSTTGNFGSNTAVVSVWTGAGSDPVGDINTAIDNVWYASGYRPNHMVIGLKPYQALRRHISVIDKTVNPNVTGGGNYPSQADIAKLFELDKILVSRTIKNQAQEDLAQDLTPVFSNHCALYYRTAGPTTSKPNHGAIFDWSNAPSPRLSAVRHAPDTQRKSQVVTVGMYQDEKVVSAAVGFLLTSATTN